MQTENQEPIDGHTVVKQHGLGTDKISDFTRPSKLQSASAKFQTASDRISMVQSGLKEIADISRL